MNIGVSQSERQVPVLPFWVFEHSSENLCLCLDLQIPVFPPEVFRNVGLTSRSMVFIQGESRDLDPIHMGIQLPEPPWNTSLISSGCISVVLSLSSLLYDLGVCVCFVLYHPGFCNYGLESDIVHP